MANTSFALGEKMSEEKLVRKIIRFIPKKFDMKVTTIEKTQDSSNIKFDELIFSLQTFELAINSWFKNMNKSITFLSIAEEDEIIMRMISNKDYQML